MFGKEKKNKGSVALDPHANGPMLIKLSERKLKSLSLEVRKLIRIERRDSREARGNEEWED